MRDAGERASSSNPFRISARLFDDKQRDPTLQLRPPRSTTRPDYSGSSCQTPDTGGMEVSLS